MHSKWFQYRRASTKLSVDQYPESQILSYPLVSSFFFNPLEYLLLVAIIVLLQCFYLLQIPLSGSQFTRPLNKKSTTGYVNHFIILKHNPQKKRREEEEEKKKRCYLNKVKRYWNVGTVLTIPARCWKVGLTISEEHPYPIARFNFEKRKKKTFLTCNE